MLKNLLYSIFLHLALIAIIYASFNLKNYHQDQLIKVAVSVVTATNVEMQSAQNNSDNVKKSEEKPKEEDKPKSKNETKTKPVKKSKVSEVKKKSKPKKVEVTKDKKIKENKKPKEEKKELKTKAPPKEQKLKELVETKVEKENKQEETKEAENDDQEEEIIAPSNSEVKSLESLNLSSRERFNIESQLRLCYKRAIKESGKDSQIKVVIAVNIAEDGTVLANFDEIVDAVKYKQDVRYKVAVDNARRALELCSPLRNLPLDKYDVWKEVLLQFDEGMKE